MKFYLPLILVLCCFQSCNNFSEIEIDDTTKEGLKNNLIRDLSNYCDLVNDTNTNLDETAKYVPEAYFTYVRKEFPNKSRDEIYHFLSESTENLRYITKTLDSRLNTGKLKYKVVILGNGVFFKSCYFYIVELKLWFEKTKDFSLPADILLVLSDNEGSTWTHLSFNDETIDILKSKYDTKLIQKIIDYKNQVFHFDSLMAETSLKIQAEDFYNSFINYDSTKLNFYMPGMVKNVAFIHKEILQKEILNQHFKTSSKIKNYIAKNNIIASSKMKDNFEKVIENNNAFYFVEIEASFKSPIKTRIKIDKLIAISENNGVNWKFFPYIHSPESVEDISQLLSSRYNDAIIKKFLEKLH